MELKNPKVLVRPSQAKSTKGKNVIIGDERLEKKLTRKETTQATTKTSTLGGGQDKKENADSKSNNLTGPNSGLTGPSGPTGAKTGLTGASNEPGNSSEAKNKRRPSFKELLAKYEREGIAQKQKGKPNKVNDMKPSSKH